MKTQFFSLIMGIAVIALTVQCAAIDQTNSNIATYNFPSIVASSGKVDKRLERGDHLPILFLLGNQMNGSQQEFTKNMQDSLRKYELTTDIAFNLPESLELPEDAMERYKNKYSQEDYLLVYTLERQVNTTSIETDRITIPFDVRYYDRGQLKWRGRFTLREFQSAISNGPTSAGGRLVHYLIPAMRQDRLMPKHDLELN
jgi:hypothetical protein